jgi:hypothetical protein
MNTPLEMIGGFEDIGIRFSLAADGSLKISVPEAITLTAGEIETIKGLKPDIVLAIINGNLLPITEGTDETIQCRS